MRLRFGIAATAALLLAGLASGATPRPTVLGVSWEGSGMLARVDARTLAPVGRRIEIGKPPIGLLARSPDGRTVALRHGSIPELRFVDVRAVRPTGRLRLPGLGPILYGTWPTPRRLVAVLTGSDPAVLVIDPRTRRVLQRRPLDGEVAGAVAVQKRLVALLAPVRTIDQARLAVVEPDGSVGIVVLPGVAAGFAPPESERAPGQQASPGVAVDPGGERAVVVTPELLLAIDLERLAVTELHHLETRALARAEKLIEGWGRGAMWVGGDTVAVSGWSYSVEGERVVRSTTGVELVDVTSGKGRELDPTAFGVVRAGGGLLTFGGTGLRGYDLGGAPRFELLRGRDTGYVQTAGPWVYVGRDNSTTFTVVDARTGRIVATARTAYPTIVLGPG